MQPYYETKLGKLYHANCNDIYKEIDTVDIVITDPPYGMEYHSGYYKKGNPHKKIIGDDRFPVEIIPFFKTITKKAIFCFCRWDNLHEVPKPKSFIVWVKDNWTAGDLKNACGRQWEGILFYPMDEHKFVKRIPDVVTCERVHSHSHPHLQLQHPTQKPVKLIEYLLKNTSEKGNIVFDPYSGSGTTAVACEKLGRKWIAVETQEEYCETTVNRLKGLTGYLPENKKGLFF